MKQKTKSSIFFESGSYNQRAVTECEHTVTNFPNFYSKSFFRDFKKPFMYIHLYFTQVHCYKLKWNIFRFHYAVSAPKANIGSGAVYICHSCFTEDHDQDKDIEIKGHDTKDFGSRFGHALAAINIDNKDGDELVVGLPLYTDTSTDKYDVGMVKVYQFKLDEYSEWSAFEVAKLSPVELTSGSRFGFAVENLGDIHKDGFDDFVVSAPYFGEEKTGAIFIYRGNNPGASDEVVDDIASNFFRSFLFINFLYY